MDIWCTTINNASSIAYIVLCCVSGKGIGALFRPKRGDVLCVYVGMHLNFFLHGLLGFAMTQMQQNDDLSEKNIITHAYDISLEATRSAVHFLLADLYKRHADFYVSNGILAFACSVFKYETIVTFVGLSCLHVFILTYHALQHHDNDWEWYTLGAAIVAYFVVDQYDMLQYPIALSVFVCCAYRVIYVGNDSVIYVVGLPNQLPNQPNNANAIHAVNLNNLLAPGRRRRRR